MLCKIQTGERKESPIYVTHMNTILRITCYLERQWLEYCGAWKHDSC